MSTCRLQYGSTFYPENDYEGEYKARMRRDLVEFSYRRDDYNTGTQLNVANYETLYPLIYFDLRAAKESMTGDSKQLVFHYRLNQAATADYKIYVIVLNEEEVVVDVVGNELVRV